jgi:hypothetical protein
MFRASRKRRSAAERRPELSEALQRLRMTAGVVDRAKEALLTAVPRGRGAGAPIAEALASFEEHLREARGSLEAWPPMSEAERPVFAGAIDESLRRAEALRLEASPQGYEELYALLGQILDPLDALAEAAERVRRASG